jgi:HAMP domain-containing protein
MVNKQSSAPRRTLSSLWKIGDWRLLPKLWAASGLVVLLSLAISGYVSITSSRDALLAQGSLNLIGTGSHTSDAIDAYLQANRNTIAAASALPDTVAFATSPSNATARANALKLLKKLKTEFDYESIEIISPQGLVLLDTAEQTVNTDVKFTPYFRDSMKGTVGYIANPSISVVTNLPAIFFSAPIFDPASVTLAVISVRDNLRRISAIVEKDWGVAGPGTFGTLLDENGIRIAHSYSAVDPGFVGKSLLFSAVAPVPADTVKQFIADKRFGNAKVENVAVLPLPEVVAALANPQVRTFESSADLSQVRYYASIASLTVKPWHYVIMAPLPVFTKPADDLAMRYLLILVIVAALTGIGAFFFARAITQPITHLTQVADRISMGELDIKIDIDRKDEIGELAQAFERMRTGMQVAMDRLRARRP